MTTSSNQTHFLDKLAGQSPRRESGCPVHFIWDGQGVGRPLVRGGFLAILLAGALLSGSAMPGLNVLSAPGLWSMSAAPASWSGAGRSCGVS